MKKYRKVLSIATALMMAALLGACGAPAKQAETEEAPVHVIADVVLDEAAGTGENQSGLLEETVTIKADAQGTPLSATLKRSGEDMEESVDITDLPFAVSISYFLDGKKVTPEELAGASGKLRMRFDYSNNTSPEVEMNGEKVQSMVPLVFISMVSLSDERFSDIEVTNGSVTNMSGTNIAYGYALPGLKDALGIDYVKDKLKIVGEAMDEDSEPEEDDPKEKEDIFPEYFEISANTENCKIEFTATMVMNGLLRDIDPEDLDDIDKMVADLGKFSDTGDELKDGVGELGEGAWELFEGLTEYADGVDALADGASQLASGASQLAAQNSALTGSASQLADGLAELKSALDAAGLQELSAQVSALASGASQLNSGIESYTGAVSQISQGASQLANGASTLSSGGEELKGGYWQLLEGISELKDGVSEMNDKLFRNIASLSEGELPDLVEHIRMLQKADKGFTEWNTYNGTEGSIRFVLETAEIS